MRKSIKWAAFITSVTVLILVIGVWQVLPGQNIYFQNTQSSEKPDHQVWDTLLKKYVDDNGWVDYDGFLSDRATLDSYTRQLSSNPPDKSTWSKKEQMAYWINAYNAFTIQLILDYKPETSIKDIGSKIQIPFINSPWDIEFIQINGKKIDLNNIEHDILRNEFDEPRIHFAIVCASYSCPKLLNEAYDAVHLDDQLESQAVEFINDPARNEISGTSASISKIFQWFTGDFTKKGTLIDFLNHFSTVTIAEDAEISYKDYNWKLNKQN